MRAPLSSLFAPVFLAIAASACVEPLQNGGVTIVGDPSSRLGTLCRFRHQTEGGVCMNDEPAVKPARTRRIAGPDDGLKGAFATGRPGDYVLENDQIVVVIDAPGSRQGLAQSGGHIIDAGDANGRADALGQVLTTFGGLENQAIYDHIEVGSGKDGSAWVEVEGHAQKTTAVRVTTRYLLSPGSREVTIQTSLLNIGTTEIAGLDFGDVIVWGGAASGAPVAPAASGDIEAPYLFGVGDGVAYAMLRDGTPFPARTSGAWSTTALVHDAALEPSKPAGYDRVLVIAPRGDTLAVASELFYLSGGAPGGVEIATTWEGKAFLRPHEDHIVLRRTCDACGGAAARLPDPPSLWMERPSGTPAAAELAPGKYTARFEGPGGTSQEVAFEVMSGKVTKVALPITPGGLLRAHVIEAEPAALEAARAEWAKAGTRAAAALQGKPSAAKIQVLDAASGAAIVAPVMVTGEIAEIALPAGKYRVVASRGPEVTIDEALVQIDHSAAADIELGLARVVDTAGYVACDLRAHTAASLDTPLTLDARLRASAAEGIECAVLTERGAAADPGPTVDALQLGARLRAFTGAAVFDSAGASGAGLLDGWIGRSSSARDRALEGFWAQLQAAHPLTPIASAFTAAKPAAEPGYPRTYVAVTDDDPAKLSAADIAGGLRRRDVVLTNGPFVTMRIGETRPGGVASLGSKRRGLLTVHVERAPWVDATELTLLVGGVPSVTIPLTGGKKSERGALIDDVTVPLTVGKPPASAGRAAKPAIAAAQDTFVVAVVRGSRSLGPVLVGDPAEMQPFAMTAPLWIDADGDGRSLGL